MGLEPHRVVESALVLDDVDVQRADADAVAREPDVNVRLGKLLLVEEGLDGHGKRAFVTHLAVDDNPGRERAPREAQKLVPGFGLGDDGRSDLRRADLEPDNLAYLGAARLLLLGRLLLARSEATARIRCILRRRVDGVSAFDLVGGKVFCGDLIGGSVIGQGGIEIRVGLGNGGRLVLDDLVLVDVVLRSGCFGEVRNSARGDCDLGQDRLVRGDILCLDGLGPRQLDRCLLGSDVLVHHVRLLCLLVQRPQATTGSSACAATSVVSSEVSSSKATASAGTTTVASCATVLLRRKPSSRL